MKYNIEVDDETVRFFRNRIDKSMPIKELLPKMLEYLCELLLAIEQNLDLDNSLPA